MGGGFAILFGACPALFAGLVAVFGVTAVGATAVEPIEAQTPAAGAAEVELVEAEAPVLDIAACSMPSPLPLPQLS